MPRACLPLLVLVFARCFAYQVPPAPAANHLADPFATDAQHRSSAATSSLLFGLAPRAEMGRERETGKGTS